VHAPGAQGSGNVVVVVVVVVGGHSAAGPGQQVIPPSAPGLTHAHSWTQTPSRQASKVQGFPSSQSVSLEHGPEGTVVVVVGPGVGGAQRGVQYTLNAGQGWSGPQASPVQAKPIVSKHPSATAPHSPSCSLQTPAARRSQSLP
jgi:hypothetical protein